MSTGGSGMSLAALAPVAMPGFGAIEEGHETKEK